MPNTTLELESEREALALLSQVSPFTSLEPHFGMLLGVEDLRVLDAYPRGKIRLHNAWLHGEGVVWGFNVFFNVRGEIEVGSGLALDRAGHELYLERAACVDLALWFAGHRDDPEFDFIEDGANFRLNLAVVARFKPCLSRPVPSIAAPCAGGESGTQYSRVQESVELLLRPIPEARELSYPRLRVFFGHVAPPSGGDPGSLEEALSQIAAERESVLGGSIPDQLDYVRRLAALDVTERLPQVDAGRRSLFPEDPSEVLLAEIRDLLVVPDGEGWQVDVDSRPDPDITVRPAHVATRAIQELLIPICCQAAASEEPEPEEPVPEEPVPEEPVPEEPAEPALDPNDTESLRAARRASRRPSDAPRRSRRGPRVADVRVSSRTITLKLDAPVEAASAVPEAFSVTRFTSADGWIAIDIGGTAVADAVEGPQIEIHLKEELVSGSVRVIARGSGPRPLLGKGTLLPLGYAGTASAAGLDGRDFVFMQPFAGRTTRR